jgi:hypothetical protein
LGISSGARVGEVSLDQHTQAEALVQLTRSPASDVTVAPRNWMRSWGLNERRIGPDSASPTG